MVVTNSCSPDPRVERHALWLTKMGHNVEIHAWDRECSNKQNETKNGYKIIRHRVGKSATKGQLKTWLRKRRFISNLSISADLLILNDTDTMGIKFQGKTLLDIHDMAYTWPLMKNKGIFNKIASKLMLKQAIEAVNFADSIIVSAPGFIDWVKQNGKSATCIMNRRNPQSISNTRRKAIGYFGKIREIKSISNLIESAKLANFDVIIAGDGVELNSILEKYPNLDYRGHFSEEDLPKLMEEISVMYAMYEDTRDNIKLGAIPTKMLDAAAFGIPTVTNANTPMGDLCLAENIGLTALYGDLEMISETIKQAYEMEIDYNKINDESKFIAVIERLLD